MYLDLWMIGIVALAFGFCAYFSYRSGLREGLASGITAGIEGTFTWLEKNNVIKFLEDGHIKGTNRKIKMVDNISQLG